ncbi:MAG TPA: hypothetical protein VFC39_05385, partial [Acidobacteriaceae bacterium]|nr:hypothetical protein [Acidobacteriaceae bacterium]
SIYKGCVLPDGLIHLLIDSTGLKVFGAGEWLQEKHGAKARRTWKKLHLAVAHVTAVLTADAELNPSQRDQHILSIAAHGRLGWQKETDYGQRALVETAMGRYKAIIGPRLRARSFSGQQAEAAIGVAILNRMLDAGHPDSVRRLNIAA